MSATTGAVENGRPTAEPPPIANVLPLLRSALTGASLLFHIAARLLLVTVYPLRITWSVIHAFLSPVTIVFKIALDVVLLIPFSIVRTIAAALYPVYVFCAVACIFGAAVGIFGHYVSTAILSAVARSPYFTQPPSRPPSSPQVALRKRKRKSTRVQ